MTVWTNEGRYSKERVRQVRRRKKIACNGKQFVRERQETSAVRGTADRERRTIRQVEGAAR